MSRLQVVNNEWWSLYAVAATILGGSAVLVFGIMVLPELGHHPTVNTEN